jgi:hypothetical protein
MRPCTTLGMDVEQQSGGRRTDQKPPQGAERDPQGLCRANCTLLQASSDAHRTWVSSIEATRASCIAAGMWCPLTAPNLAPCLARHEPQPSMPSDGEHGHGTADSAWAEDGGGGRPWRRQTATCLLRTRTSRGSTPRRRRPCRQRHPDRNETRRDARDRGEQRRTGLDLLTRHEGQRRHLPPAQPARSLPFAYIARAIPHVRRCARTRCLVCAARVRIAAAAVGPPSAPMVHPGPTVPTALGLHSNLSKPNRGYYDQRLNEEDVSQNNGPSIPHGRADMSLRQLCRLRRCWPVGPGGIISIDVQHHTTPVVDQVHHQPSI